MRARRRILALVAIGGLAGVVWVGRAAWHSRSVESRSTDPADSPHRSEIEDIHSDVASLEAALAHTQERLKQLEANKKPLEAPAPSPPEPVQRPKLTPEQLTEARQKVLDEYKLRARTFESEAADPAWAKGVEAKINSATRAALPEGAKIESVSCRTSLCKFEIAFSKQEDQRPFGTTFSNDMDAEGLRGYHFDELDRRPDGAYPLQVLVFRSGYPMPGFAER